MVIIIIVIITIIIIIIIRLEPTPATTMDAPCLGHADSSTRAAASARAAV